MIELIPLSGGSHLKRVACSSGIWELHRGETYIRTLDKYKCGFINDTIFEVSSK